MHSAVITILAESDCSRLMGTGATGGETFIGDTLPNNQIGILITE